MIDPRPLLVDLYCGAGGAGVGYHRAGFDVVGFDLAAQRNYPYTFVRADALDALRTLIADGMTYGGRPVAAIHASPPCQASSALTKGTNRATRAHLHTDLIGATRELLTRTGVPYVIENVAG